MPVYRVENGASLLAVTGIFRPRIFVAREITEVLSPDELRAALAHEMAHISSCDNLKQLLLKITRPPRWLKALYSADAEWTRVSEIAADHGALADGATVLDLSSALIKVGRLNRPSTGREAVASHLAPCECSGALETRITCLSEMLEGTGVTPARANRSSVLWPVVIAWPFILLAFTRCFLRSRSAGIPGSIARLLVLPGAGGKSFVTASHILLPALCEPKTTFLSMRLYSGPADAACGAVPAAGRRTIQSADRRNQTTARCRFFRRSAGKIYESVLPPLRAQAPGQELVDALNNLSDIATMSGEYSRAVALSRESAAACQKLQDKNCEAQAHDDAGLALSNAGNYPEAAAELDLGLKLTAETGNAQTAVLILNNLGIVYYYQAKYSEALRTYESALQYVEKSGAEAWTATWRQLTLLNLATLYQRLGNDQRAIKTYNDVLDHPKDLSPRDVGHIHANLGVLYRRLGDAEQALKSYRLAERFYAREKDVDGELGVLKNTGIVLALDLGRLQEALKTFDRVRALAAQTNNQREAMQALLYRGETLYRMGKLPEAEKGICGSAGGSRQTRHGGRAVESRERSGQDRAEKWPE